MNKFCVECGEDSGRYMMCEPCNKAWIREGGDVPYFKEMGVENPSDKKGSTAHVRDIKSRRVNPQTGEIFRYQGEKKYFFVGDKR